MTSEFNCSLSTTENKVPLIPTALWSHRIWSQAGSDQASIWLEAGRALEPAAPRLKQGHTSLPVRPLCAAGAHKVLGAHSHSYGHLQPLFPPLCQVWQLLTSPIHSKQLSRSTALPSDPRLLSNNASYPHFLIWDAWVALGCLIRTHPGWKIWDGPSAPRAGFTRSSVDLSPRSKDSQTENPPLSLLWLLTYFFPIFYSSCSLT